MRHVERHFILNRNIILYLQSVSIIEISKSVELLCFFSATIDPCYHLIVVTYTTMRKDENIKSERVKLELSRFYYLQSRKKNATDIKEREKKSKIKKRVEGGEEKKKTTIFYSLLPYRRPIFQFFSFFCCFSFCDYCPWIQFQENSILHLNRSAKHTFI